MSQKTVEYREMHLGLRAPRAALLVDRSSGPEAYSAIVEALSGVWAGAACALIPTDGASISPPFWRLLELHDPDAVLILETALQVTPGLADQIRRRCSQFALAGPGNRDHLRGVGHEQSLPNADLGRPAQRTGVS